MAKKVTSGANAFILENHGVLALGGDAEQAVHNMALLEKVALDYLLALLTDGRAEKVPLPIREIAFAKLRKDEKKLAQQVEQARAAREAAEARAAETGGRGGRARRPLASGRRRRLRLRRPGLPRRPAPPALSSPATPSAATRTSPTSTGG